MILFPTFTKLSSKFSYNIAIGAQTFSFSFYFNSREQSWYLSIADSSGNPLINGVKLVPEYLLLKSHRAAIPQLPGDLVLVDLEGNPASSGVTFDNFGVRYVLMYFTAGELA